MLLQLPMDAPGWGKGRFLANSMASDGELTDLELGARKVLLLHELMHLI